MVGKLSYPKSTPVSGFTWQYSENPEYASGNDPLTSYELWEQINVTRDSSDYLWHVTKYHVPRSWLNPNDNFSVVFEEWGGDPMGISLVKRTRTR
ncbi:hypothetical protein L6164_013962 [Bauhinia variegata]|nr:hypothetical protein L6164_013962 [Bauhinia variegata]